MSSRGSYVVCALVVAICAALGGQSAVADEPKPTAQNTIALRVANPPKVQTFTKPVKFFLADVIDRSGNAQPLLVFKPRGGVFLDRQPVAIVREAIAESLKQSDMLAADAASADQILTVYLFHFGLSEGSGFEFFGKVEWAGMLKRQDRAGQTMEVPALGTSIASTAVRKSNILKNVTDSVQSALQDCLRNFVRGVKLRDAVEALASQPPKPVPAGETGKP